ncbi:MAG TPA: hypothetical protein PLG50_04990 [bacterium]|nr:hypothetical protein [bacterium]HQG44992.1 hypothetical protein [bacterium]HQI48048.1 hypothetical protein [bacterium]HQJ65966.1 hypothetical protein [bacterium]
MVEHCRWYSIGDITLQVESDLPFSSNTFSDKLELFRIASPGPDVVTVRHHFGLPDMAGWDLSREKYRREPWAIYQTDKGWIYLGILPQGFGEKLWKVVVFSPEHSQADIYHPDELAFVQGGATSLTLFPSDQILVARLLADRSGCYLHSAGAILDGHGMLFVGHSEAGKSTTTQMLIDAGARGDLAAEILCDDRNIVRRFDDGWRAYGSWSHGDIPVVSAALAPLRAICFIEKSAKNSLTPLTDRQEIIRRLLACVIKPFVTAEWWEKTIDVVAQLAAEARFFLMRFDKSGKIVSDLVRIARSSEQNG